MGFLGGYILGLLTAIIPQVILFFLLPALEEPRRKFLAWLQRRPHIKPKLLAEMKTLEQEIIPRLLKINAIPSNPDGLKAMQIREILEYVGIEARNTDSKEFSELRSRLIVFADHAGSINVNTNPLTILKMLGRDTAMSLVSDIRQEIADTIKGKDKKKK